MDFVQALESLDSAQKYVADEVARFRPIVDDAKYKCHFVFADHFSVEDFEQFVAPFFKEKTDFWRKALRQRFMAETTMAGARRLFVFSDEKGIRHILSVILFQKDPKALIFETVCALMNVLQTKRLYPEYFENLEKQFLSLQEKGLSAEKIEHTFKSTVFNYEKVKTITAAYKKIQAYASAAVYLMVLAGLNGNKNLFEDVLHYALQSAAALSDGLVFEAAGAGSCAFPVVKELLAQIENGSGRTYLTAQNMVDWNKLYDYTLAATKNIGYTAHQIMDTDKKEGAFLRALKKQYPDRKTMLSVLKWSPDYKGSKILQDYAKAQDYLLKSV